MEPYYKFQLSSEERLLLHAAKLGDAELIKDLLDSEEHLEKLNINCVDYMGRNALFLAVDTENIDAIGNNYILFPFVLVLCDGTCEQVVVM